MSQERSIRFIPVWAIGETRPASERERRLTAAVYRQIPGVLEHVRREGRLPPKVETTGAETGLRAVVQRRGLDIELSEAEEAVLRVMARDEEAPAGRAVLIACG